MVPNAHVSDCQRLVLCNEVPVRRAPLLGHGLQAVDRVAYQPSSDCLDVVAQLQQRLVVQDHATVEDEGRLQHAVVDSLVVVRLQHTQCKSQTTWQQVIQSMLIWTVMIAYPKLYYHDSLPKVAQDHVELYSHDSLLIMLSQGWLF